jgi:pyrroline-5-carboxylate reductase
MAIGLGGPLLLVGCGKMGGALLEAWLDEGLDPASVAVLDPSPPDEVRDLLRRSGVALNPAPGPAPAVVVVAVKPQLLDEVLPEIAGRAGPQTLALSIVAGKPIAAFAGLPAVVRAMPNTPAAVRRGITVAVPSPAVTAQQKSAADSLLRAAGAVEWIDDETLIDAVTAVSGSGPAYVFLLAETLAAAGAAAGLPADLAERLARATVSGAGELLARSPEPAATLRTNVTSRGGTTQAALDVLMAPDGLPPLMQRAVAAAAKRAKELAG